MPTPLLRSPRRPVHRYVSGGIGDLGVGVVWVAAVGTIASLVAVVYPLTVTGPDSQGFEFLWLFLGVAALVFFGPGLVCAVVGVRTGRAGPTVAGRLLVGAGLCGGPIVVLMVFFSVVGSFD